MTDDYLTGEDFAERYGVTLSFTGPDTTTDERGWEHYAYEATLSYAATDRDSTPRTLVVPWRQGLALTDDPDIGQVLESLALDYRSGALDWDDFAADFGYDEDSRRDHAIWEACQAQHHKIGAWVSCEAMREDFANISERRFRPYRPSPTFVPEMRRMATDERMRP